MTREEFETGYSRIFERAVTLSEKTRHEGMLSIEEIIDEGKLFQRDIMELGLRLACDGIDPTIIDNILTNIINQENDKDEKILKTVQKTAVLCIQQGYSRGIFALTLNSLVDVCYRGALDIYLDIGNYPKPSSADEIDHLLNGDEDESGPGSFNKAFDEYQKNNYDKAVPEFMKLAEAGNEKACFYLGICYQHNLGLEQDFNKAKEWFLKAAELGNLEGYERIGLCYENGIGTKKDYAEAFNWFLKAAELGHDESQRKVGHYYAAGRTVERNLNKAAEWIKKAADQGDFIAKMDFDNLKNNPETFTGTLPQNEIDDLLSAAGYGGKEESTGDSDSNMLDLSEDNFDLAVNYLKGDGVEQDYAKADELFRKDLETKKEMFGEDSFQGKLCYAIGDRYRDHEDYEIAISWFMDALAIYKKEYAGKHQDITDTLCFIAICHEKKGDYLTAIDYYKDTVESDETINGKGNQNIALYLNQISFCYVKLEDYRNALDYSMKALAIREEIFGTEHSDTALIYYKIAEIYFMMNDYENALIFYDKAYLAYKKCNGKDDINANDSLLCIAFCHEEMGEYGKALSCYKDAVVIYEKVLGKDHLSTAVAFYSISGCYYNLKDYEKALESDLEALFIRERICEEDAPELSLSLNNTGTDYRFLGRYEEALKYHFKALELRKKYSKQKDNIAFSFRAVGKDYEAQGDRENAVKYFKEALSIYMSLEGFETDAEDTRQAIARNI